MASAPDHGEDMFDRFLSTRGHEAATWDRDHNKKQCPECGGIHADDATDCSVCGWKPGP